MTTYTSIYPTSGPSAATSYSGDFGCALAFEVTESNCWLEGFWWWVCSTGGQSTAPQDFCLWQATGDDQGSLVPDSEVTSGTLAAGWNWVPFSTPIALTPGVSYRAVTAFTGPFPDTNSQFGSGDPYSAGITSGPLNVYGDGTGGGTNLDPWNNAQGSFQTSSSDPTAGFPTNSYESGNFWIDVQITQTAPSSADDRLWPNSVSPVGNMHVDSDTTGYMLATGFELSAAASLSKIWFYSGSGATELPTKCAIWDSTTSAVVAGSENDAPVWSGAAGSGWVSCDFTGVSLVSGRPYHVAVYYAGGAEWYAAMTDFWNTSPWSAGLGSGILSSHAIVGSTPSSYSSSWEYPTTAGTSDEVYFVDVEVTPSSGLSGSGSASLSIAATGSAVVVLMGSGAGTVHVAAAAGSSLVTLAGAGSAAVDLGASGVGVVNLSGSGAASLSVDASGAGGVTLAGSGAATLHISSTGTAEVVLAGSGTASVSLSATGTAQTGDVINGSGSAGITLQASGSGLQRLLGAGAASIDLQSSGAGQLTVLGGGGALVSLVAGGGGIVQLTGAGAANLELAARGSGWVPGTDVNVEVEASEPYSSWSAGQPYVAWSAGLPSQSWSAEES